MLSPQSWDWNDSASTEIGKTHDWNGYTNTQIWKVFNWNGSASTLVYSAETMVASNLSASMYNYVEYATIETNRRYGDTLAFCLSGYTSVVINFNYKLMH